MASLDPGAYESRKGMTEVCLSCESTLVVVYVFFAVRFLSTLYYLISNLKRKYSMNLKFKALVLAASMMAAPVFAADIATDLAVIGASTDLAATDLPGLNAVVMAEDISAVAYDGYNVGYISQQGDGNYALIDQTGGTGNYAAILQTADNPVAVGVIAQNGNGNRASINQH